MGDQIFLRGRGWVWHQNLSAVLLSRAPELPRILFWPPRVHRLYNNIPSSSNLAIEKSGQIKQSTFCPYDDHCPAGTGRKKANKFYALFRQDANLHFTFYETIQRCNPNQIYIFAQLNKWNPNGNKSLKKWLLLKRKHADVIK